MKRTARSILFGTFLLFILSPGNRAESLNGKTNQPGSGKIPQPVARQEPSTNSILLGLQEQIRILNKRIDHLEGKNPSFLPTRPENEKKSIYKVADTPPGHIPVPGTSTSLKISGYIKADGIYDASQYSGDASNLPNLRLKGLDTEADHSRVWTAHVKQTRLAVGTHTQASAGQVMTHFEGDFFGSMNTGSSSGSFSRSDTSSLNSYNFRVRHAYGSFQYNNDSRIEIGQMWSLFYDPKSTGTTIEFNGPETTAQLRRPQVRYTRIHRQWRFSVSAESGATDYLDISPAFAAAPGSASLTAGSPSPSYNSSQYRRAQNSFLGGINGDGSQGLPDLVAQLQYEKKDSGHFTLGIVGRQLKVRKTATTGANDPPFHATRYGYGLAMGGRLNIYGRSSLYGHMSFGHGIGAYIFALDGYGAAVDASRKLMKTQFAYGLLAGFEHYWAENWRSNVIFSLARACIADFIPRGRVPVIGINGPVASTGYSISHLMRQFYINILWAPAEKFEMGLEYGHFRRDTINNYLGYANRFQFGVYYRF